MNPYLSAAITQLIGNVPYSINNIWLMGPNTFNVDLVTFECGFPIRKNITINLQQFKITESILDLRTKNSETSEPKIEPQNKSQLRGVKDSSETPTPEIESISINGNQISITGSNFSTDKIHPSIVYFDTFLPIVSDDSSMFDYTIDSNLIEISNPPQTSGPGNNLTLYGTFGVTVHNGGNQNYNTLNSEKIDIPIPSNLPIITNNDYQNGNFTLYGKKLKLVNGLMIEGLTQNWINPLLTADDKVTFYIDNNAPLPQTYALLLTSDNNIIGFMLPVK